MKLVNLTPHPVRLCGLDIQPSGQVARVSTTEVVVDNIDVDGTNVPILSVEFGEVVGLPEPEDGTIFIVSALVAQAARRSDVMSPGRLVRDPEGRVIGADGLIR